MPASPDRPAINRPSTCGAAASPRVQCIAAQGAEIEGRKSRGSREGECGVGASSRWKRRHQSMTPMSAMRRSVLNGAPSQLMCGKLHAARTAPEKPPGSLGAVGTCACRWGAR